MFGVGGSPGPMWPAPGPVTRQYMLTDVAQDAAGNPLAGVRVSLFRTSDNLFLGSTLTNASGTYQLIVPDLVAPGATFYTVGYRAGAPDLYATSLNTLAPT